MLMSHGMSTRVLRIGVLLTLVSSLLVGGGAAANGETLIVGGPGAQSGGRTDGRWVVWLDSRDGAADGPGVFASRLDGRVAFPIAIAAISATSPDIDNGVIVWAEQLAYASTWTIRAEDLDSGDRPTVAQTIGTHAPDPRISGTRVVWRDDDSNTQQPVLMMRDIQTDEVPVVLATALPDAEGIWDVEMAGDRVVWWEGYFSNRSWTWWIRSIDIGEAGSGNPLTIAEGSMYPPSYDVGGDVVVYSDNLGLFVMDMTTEDVQRIDTQDVPALATPRDPTTDGRYVFWQADRQRDGDLHADLLGHDLWTDTAFTIIADAGAYQSLQPQTAGGYLIWQIGTDEDRDIHAASLSALLHDDSMSFPETGHDLSGHFRDFWQANGGLAVFGYPVTQEFIATLADSGTFATIQYVERQRYEWHPANAGTPYEVLLGRLGAELLEQQGRDWTTFERADPSAPHYVPVTGHAIDERFHAYWTDHGLDLGDEGISYRESLALFGYPISEPMLETNADGDRVLTQYFERAVFEYHPDNPPAYQVLLRRIGVELLGEGGW